MAGAAANFKSIDAIPTARLREISCAFVDLDGTSLSKQKVPSNGFWAAVAAFEASGGRVVPATGSAREAAQVKLRKADASGAPCPEDVGVSSLCGSGADLGRAPGIFQNGAEVRADGAEISQSWLGVTVLDRLLTWFSELSCEERGHVGLSFQSYGNVWILAAPSELMEIPEAWRAVRKDQYVVPALELWSRCPYYIGEGLAQALPLPELRERLRSSNVHCAMILTSVAAQPRWAASALDALGETADSVTHLLSLVDPSPVDRTAYVFTHPAASKGSALELLAAHFQLDPSCCIAFGDNMNDKPMFDVPGVLGVAVENGSSELKAAADVLTATNEAAPQAGVAQVLLKIAEVRQSASSHSPHCLQ